MPKTTATASLTRAIKEVRVFLKESRKKQVKPPRPLVPVYIRHINREAWEKLARDARRELKELKTGLENLAAKKEKLTGMQPKVQELTTAYQEVFKPFISSPGWQPLRRSLAGHLLQKGKTEAQANALLKKAETIDPKTLKQTFSLDASAQHLDALATAYMAAMMGATLALSVARFNEDAGDNGSVTRIRNFYNQAGRKITAAQKQVWEDLKTMQPELPENSAALTRLAAGLLLNECLPYAAALAGKRISQEDKTAKKETRELALQLGELIRQLLFSIALGRQLSWVSASGPQTALLKTWQNAAKKLPFSGKNLTPKAISIKTLLAKPDTYEQKFITLEGTLEKITITHQGKKAVSSAQLTDPYGNAVEVALPYIKLDSGGMVAGAYVRISGVWQNQNKETKGPALAIDRLNLQSLAKESWLAWTRLQLNAVFQPVPHGLNAAWTWEKGTDGAGNPLRYNQWHQKEL